jgi:hypothetical protein
MGYGKLCQEILNLDPKIRFTGVCVMIPEKLSMAANEKV